MQVSAVLPAMTFHDSGFAPDARRVRIFLAEKGMVCLDFMKMARIGLPHDFSHPASWRERLSARPGHAA